MRWILGFGCPHGAAVLIWLATVTAQGNPSTGAEEPSGSSG
ncbi:MAG: hypothetical protein WAU20_09940 [Dokdonella sp.]